MTCFTFSSDSKVAGNLEAIPALCTLHQIDRIFWNVHRPDSILLEWQKDKPLRTDTVSFVV